MSAPSNTTSFFVTVFFTTSGNRLQITQYSDPQGKDLQVTIPRGIELPVDEMEAFLKAGTLIVDFRDDLTIPETLLTYPKQLGCEAAAYVPILQEGRLRGLVLIGARKGQVLNDDVVNAFARTIRLTATSLLPINPPSQPLITDRRNLEAKALNSLLAGSATMKDLHSFYTSIHDQVRTVVGDHGFLIALYNEKTNSISVPYLFEDGKFSSIDAFPLGEGLTSILIRTREPLMLVEDTMKRATAMGAKIAGKPAQSWMGVPHPGPGGTDRCNHCPGSGTEHAFDDEDLQFVTSVANQVSSFDLQHPCVGRKPPRPQFNLKQPQRLRVISAVRLIWMNYSKRPLT